MIIWAILVFGFIGGFLIQNEVLTFDWYYRRKANRILRKG